MYLGSLNSVKEPEEKQEENVFTGLSCLGCTGVCVLPKSTIVYNWYFKKDNKLTKNEIE